MIESHTTHSSLRDILKMLTYVLRTSLGELYSVDTFEYDRIS